MNFLRTVFELLFLSRQKRLDKHVKEYMSTLEMLEIHNQGFQLKSKDKGVFLTIFWNDVTKADYNIKNIVFYTENDQHTIKSEMPGWQTLLVNIPKGIANFDYAALNQFLSRLSGCKSCGLIAYYEKECLNCGLKNWNDELAKEYASEAEYLREMQIEEFEYVIDVGAIKIENKPRFGFKVDHNWKSLITIKDLDVNNE